MFTKSGFFVNPACAPLDVFVEDGGCLKWKGPLSTAVCLITGIITECCIISQGMSGPPDSVKSVHKVCIAPFHQDFQHDTTAWGKVLGFNMISCAVFNEGIAFTMRLKSTFFAASLGEFFLFPYFCILYNVS